MAFGSHAYGSVSYGGGLNTVRTVTTRPGKPHVILRTKQRRATLFTNPSRPILVTRKQMAVL
jgi:hypothetical protein